MLKNIQLEKHVHTCDHSGLCSKRPDMRSVSDLALNPSVRKHKSESSQHLFIVSYKFELHVVPFDVHCQYFVNAFICTA